MCVQLQALHTLLELKGPGKVSLFLRAEAAGLTGPDEEPEGALNFEPCPLGPVSSFCTILPWPCPQALSFEVIRPGSEVHGNIHGNNGPTRQEVLGHVSRSTWGYGHCPPSGPAQSIPQKLPSSG